MITIREMTATDVEPAADAVQRGGWFDRSAFFGYAVASPACTAFLAEADGDIVGTGVATRHGAAGWVGTIWTAPEHRGRGIGRAMTERVMDDLAGHGCATIVLVATHAGRPLYERLGFRPVCDEVTIEGPGLAAGTAPAAVRPFGPADVEAALALDRAATGEDRRHLVAAGTGWAADDADGALAGFALRAPFGGPGIVAVDPAAALALVRALRAHAGPVATLRLGLPDANPRSVTSLIDEGWIEHHRGTRMVLGPQPAWAPAMLWGDFSFATG